ncbi:hypothetical protein NQ318_020587 [Aromia moschata]|uniref:Uncharacterized protein n=1 Tax=Aromia moschata TaxID=1265417 RepID=A0AAV8Z330_9CUCU|nr:hypothetical protein NQ318_020587 [Aromia moschata]
MKQISWEDKRNRWVKGFNKAVGGGKEKKSNGRSKQFGKKRPSQSNFGNKQKKLKKLHIVYNGSGTLVLANFGVNGALYIVKRINKTKKKY